MRNFLALVGAAVVTVVCLGWYLGWYRIQSEPTAPGMRKFDVEVNAKKIGEDLSKGKDRLSKVLAGDGQQPPSPAAPAPVAPPRQVEGQPTGLHFNDDGSITYRGNVTLPPIVPRQ